MKGNSVKGGLADKDPAIGLFTHMNNHLRFFWHLGRYWKFGRGSGSGGIGVEGDQKGAEVTWKIVLMLYKQLLDVTWRTLKMLR